MLHLYGIRIVRRALMMVMAFVVGVACWADDPASDGSADASKIEKFTTDELHKLVAPIALYPDALLAQVLPASTYPIQIVEAYRYTQIAGTLDIPPENSTWDSSVIALLHYPPVLKKLNDDLTWTDQLGVAVTYQMADLTLAIQQVRAEAEAAGNLKSNDKQQIIVEKDIIQIVPANPQFIYIPTYNPELISNSWYDTGPPIYFGVGFGFGMWLSNDFDWYHHRIWLHHHWWGGRWRPYEHSGFWHPSYHPIPHWYLKNGGARPGLPGRPRIDGGRITGSKLDRVHPNPTRLPNAKKPPIAPRPAIKTPQKFSGAGEGLGNSGHQTNKESNRGQGSRGNIKTPTPSRLAPAQAPSRPAPTRPSYHDGFNNPRDGATTHRESNRGTASRGATGQRR